MNLGDTLLKIGGAIAKSTPIGRVVYDIVDAVIDDPIPDDITGAGLAKALEKLPVEEYARVMSKQIDAEVAKYQTWADLRAKMETPSDSSKARNAIAIGFGVVVMILTLMFSYLFIQNYLALQTFPPIEVLLVVYGLPTVCLLAAFGIRSDKLLDVLLNVAAKKL